MDGGDTPSLGEELHLQVHRGGYDGQFGQYVSPHDAIVERRAIDHHKMDFELSGCSFFPKRDEKFDITPWLGPHVWRHVRTIELQSA